MKKKSKKMLLLLQQHRYYILVHIQVLLDDTLAEAVLLLQAYPFAYAQIFLTFMFPLWHIKP